MKGFKHMEKRHARCLKTPQGTFFISLHANQTTYFHEPCRIGPYCWVLCRDRERDRVRPQTPDEYIVTTDQTGNADLKLAPPAAQWVVYFAEGMAEKGTYGRPLMIAIQLSYLQDARTTDRLDCPCYLQGGTDIQTFAAALRVPHALASAVERADQI